MVSEDSWNRVHRHHYQTLHSWTSGEVNASTQSRRERAGPAQGAVHWSAAAGGPARSRPGPHWWAAARPRCPRRSSGSLWGTPLWAPPAALHSGSLPRRRPGCPAPWTWCHTRWSPDSGISAQSWPGWTTQTAAPKADVCLKTRCYEEQTRAPSTRPALSGGHLGMGEAEGEERGEERMIQRREEQKKNGH